VLATVGVAIGWFFIGPEFYSPLSFVVVGGVAVLALLGSWTAGFLVLRGRGVRRAVAISWWTLGGTVLVAGIVAAALGGLAFVISMLTVAAMWTGDFIEPVVVVTVAVNAVFTILIGMVMSSTAASSMARVAQPAPPDGSGVWAGVAGAAEVAASAAVPDEPPPPLPLPLI
jgi:hypothetical protein